MLLFGVALAATADLARVQERLEEVSPLMGLRLAETRPPIPDAAWTKAAAGEVATGIAEVEGHEAKIGWGVAVVEVAIDRFWRGLNDELYHQELLGMGHIELVRGSVCQDRRHVMMLLPLPLVSDRWWVVENRYARALEQKSGGSVRELSWHQVKVEASELSETAQGLVEDAVPLAFNTGAWLLVALEEQTLVEYHAWSDPGGDIPAGPASSFASASIEDTIRTMERYATDNEPRCR